MTQRKQILIFNLLLAAAALGLSWKLAADWKQAAAGQLPTAAGGNGAAGNYTLPASAPSTAGSQIIARNPFSQDRNSIVAAPAVAESGPPPAVPVVVGTMRLSGGYEALMAESAQNASTSFRQMKAGGEIGGYKVVEIRDDEVVVERNGERTTINVYLSASGVARSSARSLPSGESAPVASAPRIETSAAPAPAASGQVRSAAPAAGDAVQMPSPDPLLKITIEGNRRRYERTTMFGPQVWYEDIR